MAARLVYTSGPAGPAAACPRCAAHPCRCAEAGNAASAPPSSQSVRVRRERAGRKGRTVTVAAPLVLARSDAAELLAELKRRCGAGGTLKPVETEDGRPALALEIQGDHVAAVLEHLRTRGFRARS